MAMDRKGNEMKVSELIEIMNTLPPDTEICALWWERETFDDPNDPITDECWTKVGKEFDNWDDAGANITDWIADAVIDNS